MLMEIGGAHQVGPYIDPWGQEPKAGVGIDLRGHQLQVGPYIDPLG